MNGIMNKNQVALVKEYKFDNPLIHRLDSIIGKGYKDCHNNYLHIFKYRCIQNINFTKIRKK